MAINDAIVKVDCDACHEIEEVELMALAQRGSWDERSVIPKLQRMGWFVKDKGEVTICPECHHDAESEPTEDE